MTDLLPTASDTHGAPSITSVSGTRTQVVLDTSVLVADPNCLHAYDDSDIVIPLIVIEELDGLKTRPDDAGRSARAALRAIEDLRNQAGGAMDHPVPVGGRGGTVRIELNGVQKHILIEHSMDPDKPDNRIIGAALGQAVHAPTTLVSNDAALRIKAAHLGLNAITHFPVGRAKETRSMGWTTIDLDAATGQGGLVDELYAAGGIEAAVIPEAAVLLENEFAVLRSGSQSALSRRVGSEMTLLHSGHAEPWGLRPRSKEQRFALELLLDPSVSVVALDGSAGTGKTVMAIAAGLEQVVEQRNYERLAVYRPLVPVGRAEVGFLPGGLDEKLDPWMSAIHDAIVALTDQRLSQDARRLIDELIARGQLSLESVTFLRGRSLHRQIVVVDEAQNLEPTTLKTILTRIGEGTKVIFTGDTSQIDAPYLGESNNALAVLIQAFANQTCFGHITLTSCERSEVASLAAELL